MRFVILLSGILIAGAIDPTQVLPDKTAIFIAGVCIIAIIMDIAEFFKEKK